MLYFTISRMDIFQSYFFGEVMFGDSEYSINVQTERRGRVLRLPFGIVPRKARVLARLTGPGIHVEDYLEYIGESEWVEIDSTTITYSMADNQDRFTALEIYDRAMPD